MPAFTFEKISPPARRGSAPSASTSSSTNPPTVNSVIVNSATANSANTKKQRSVFVQIIGRFVEVRTRRSLRAEKGTLIRRDPKA